MRWRGLLKVLGLALLSAQATAHENRPIYIELTEVASRDYQLQWKIPLTIPSFAAPTVMLPGSCSAQGAAAEFAAPDGLIRRVRYYCAQSLAGQVLILRYPGSNPSISSLIRYSSAAGERHLAVLRPDEMRWTVPQAETVSGVALQYTLLGIEHIWIGIDHLLFLVCLLWIAGTLRRTLITITGFTVAHSITLILSALELQRVPVPPVEAAIALSIMFLAREIVRGPRASLTWRFPVAVSSAFGLLHGLGFAAALSEIGLPQTELATGLLCFNLGVEIGQVMFVATTIGSVRVLKSIAGQRFSLLLGAAWGRPLAGYAVGALSTFWLIERMSA